MSTETLGSAFAGTASYELGESESAIQNVRELLDQINHQRARQEIIPSPDP
jgi:hypothetical protein